MQVVSPSGVLAGPIGSVSMSRLLAAPDAARRSTRFLKPGVDAVTGDPSKDLQVRRCRGGAGSGATWCVHRPRSSYVFDVPRMCFCAFCFHPSVESSCSSWLSYVLVRGLVIRWPSKSVTHRFCWLGSHYCLSNVCALGQRFAAAVCASTALSGARAHQLASLPAYHTSGDALGDALGKRLGRVPGGGQITCSPVNHVLLLAYLCLNFTLSGQCHGLSISTHETTIKITNPTN